MLKKNPQFSFLIPDIYQTSGGIQTYSLFLLQALQLISPHSQYEVLLKNNTSPPPQDLCLSQTQFHYFGHFFTPIRTLIFATQVLRRGITQDLLITTHLNFTAAAVALLILKKIPYWTIAHGIEAWNIQNPLIKVALKNADRILAVSSYTRDRLLSEQNLDPEKVVLLPNTFDSDRFQIESKPIRLLNRHNLDSIQPVILTVARLAEVERYKGYDQILKALPSIRQIIPNIHYVLVGKGGDRPRIEALIDQLQLQDCVTLAGFIPDEELCDYYNLCDVFAMPSKREGFGIVYLEALACGKPTLGGNQDGAVDALCQGKLGALVNPDNIDEIAQTLIQILQGSYPNSLMYQPQALRQQVIEIFGFDRFKQTLAGYLAESNFL